MPNQVEIDARTVTVDGDGNPTVTQPGGNEVTVGVEVAAATVGDGDKGVIVISSGVWSFDSAVVTAAALTVLDDATVGAMVDTLGGAASTGSGGLVRKTSPTFAGVPAFPTGGLSLRDSGDNFDLTIVSGGLSDARTLTITCDGTRTLTIAGTASVSGTNTGDQSTFATVAVSGQSDVVADAAADTLTLAAGTGITITTTAGSDTVTFTPAVSSVFGRTGAVVAVADDYAASEVFDDSSWGSGDVKQALNDIATNFTNHPSRACYVLSSARLTLTNLPAAATWLGGTVGSYYLKTDLTNFTKVRLTAYVTAAGSPGSPKIRVGYDLTPSTPPVIGDFSADIGTSEVSVSLASTGIKDTGWISLAAGAIANDVYVALETSGGDGVMDPSVASINLEFKK